MIKYTKLTSNKIYIAQQVVILTVPRESTEDLIMWKSATWSRLFIYIRVAEDEWRITYEGKREQFSDMDDLNGSWE